MVVNLFGCVPRMRTYPSFTMTQVAKYIPGNIAHLIGRGLYLRGNTLTDPQIVKATLIELAVIPTGALVCILLLGSMGYLTGLAPRIPPAIWWLCTLAAPVAVLATIVAAERWGLKISRFLPSLLISTGLAMMFMATLGLTFAITFQTVGTAPLISLAGASILAWLIGFLTPGAPGGIGIREAMLVALLGGLNQADNVLIAAVMFRIVTTLGDVVILGAGWLIFRKTDPLSTH